MIPLSQICVAWLRHLSSFSCLIVPDSGSAIPPLWVPAVGGYYLAQSMMVPGLYMLLWVLL